MPYRLLRRGEPIAETDEMLDDDCETWRPVGRDILARGAAYEPSFFVPMRRSVPGPGTEHD